MEFLSLVILLAMTYHQVAARPASNGIHLITNNGLASSEGFETNSNGEIEFGIPTNIQAGLVITIKGTINKDDKTFTVELPSKSADEYCQMKYDFDKETIYISPAAGVSEESYINIASGSAEVAAFSLRLIPRSRNGQDILTMIFNAHEEEQSPQLDCRIDNFEDIDRIVMKKGVARVDSLLFEFENS